MNTNEFFPSTGFEDGLDNAQWGALQKYLAQAAALPKSLDAKTEAILEKVHAAASECSTTVLPLAHGMGNTLYNYAMTMVATLSGLEQLMGQDAPPKPAIEQLVDNLKASAAGALADPQKANQGLAGFQNASSASGHALTQRLSLLKTRALAVNKAVGETSRDLESGLAASNPDAAAVDADMEALQNAVAQFKGMSFIGLTFSVTPGVTAAARLVSGVKDEVAAWNALVKQLSGLSVEIKQSTETGLRDLPGLSREVLKDAQTRWQAVEKTAHGFMLNFFITPAHSLSVVQGAQE